MKLPHTHTSRYSKLHKTAAQKGFYLEPNQNGSWVLLDRDTHQPSPAGFEMTLDDVASYLMVRPLIG
jgi:hypothetical protein